MRIDLPRRLLAEGGGTAALVATVVGSGIMAERLTSDGALALLCNTLPTGAILVVLISVLGPVSGAHLNPAVTFAFWLRGTVSGREAGPYALAQVAGGIAGAALAHLMFELPVVQMSATARTGAGQWIAEVVATFALVATIVLALRVRAEAVAWLVALTIVAAYWFTASTSFANPAVAVARGLSYTFAGIRPQDVPAFVLAELAGAALGAFAAGWLVRPLEERRT